MQKAGVPNKPEQLARPGQFVASPTFVEPPSIFEAADEPHVKNDLDIYHKPSGVQASELMRFLA